MEMVDFYIQSVFTLIFQLQKGRMHWS